MLNIMVVIDADRPQCAAVSALDVFADVDSARRRLAADLEDRCAREHQNPLGRSKEDPELILNLSPTSNMRAGDLPLGVFSEAVCERADVLPPDGVDIDCVQLPDRAVGYQKIAQLPVL